MWEEWAAKDPIKRVERIMIDQGWCSREELDAVHARIKREADEAIEWAENSPYPNASTLTEGVYEGSR